jgi:hypothetical protein
MVQLVQNYVYLANGMVSTWLRLVELVRIHLANLEADEHYPEDDDDQVMIRLAEVRCTNGDLPTGMRS